MTRTTRMDRSPGSPTPCLGTFFRPTTIFLFVHNAPIHMTHAHSALTYHFTTRLNHSIAMDSSTSSSLGTCRLSPRVCEGPCRASRWRRYWRRTAS